MANEYEIGYGRPPQRSRFKPGQSGNPVGRPKASPNVQTELKRLLAQKTKIKIGGSVQTVSASRAMCLALLQKAMSGDVRAFSKIVEIAGADVADELKAAAATMREEDFDIVTRALARREGQTPGAPALEPVEPSTSTAEDHL